MADPIEQLSYRQVLRDRRLALLIGGDMVSGVGDGMVIVALPLLTLRIHGTFDPALAVALIEAAPYALAVALAVGFGLGRRRFQPRAVLAVDCVMRAVVLTGVGLLALASVLSLWLLGVALVAGCGLRLVALSSRRLVATAIAGEHGRFAVNGLLGTGESLAAYVVGPVAGGILAAATSPGLVLLLDGASFVALLGVVLVVIAPDPGEDADDADDAGDAGDPASGWAIMRRIPVTARLLGIVFLFNLFYMPIEVALPLLVRGPLHSSGAALGAIWTGFGAGALVGSLATNNVRRLPHPPLLVAIIAAWGCCVAVLAATPNVAVTIVIFAVGGLVYAPFTPVAYSLVQSRLDAGEQQPVLAVWAAGSAIAAPIGLLLGGPLIGLAGIRAGVLVSAALTICLVPVAARSLRRPRPPALTDATSGAAGPR